MKKVMLSIMFLSVFFGCIEAKKDDGLVTQEQEMERISIEAEQQRHAQGLTVPVFVEAEVQQLRSMRQPDGVIAVVSFEPERTVITPVNTVDIVEIDDDLDDRPNSVGY